MKIAIVGFAGQGQSSYEYWNKDGNEITICDADQSVEVPAGAKSKLGVDYLSNLNTYDLIIRTPALHPRELVSANNSQILDKVWSNTNEFFKVCPTKNIIGVTGTKGKGTTSSLITAMLKACGKRVHLGGNIGIPPLDLLKNEIKSDDWVVLELANFQLIDIKSSPHIGVCLMVVPEHLDWHTDISEYITAKQQLFCYQSKDDIAIYFAENENSINITKATKGILIPYFQKPGAHIENGTLTIDGVAICRTDEIKLLGRHNWQNACAAITALWQVSQNAEAAKDVLTSFSGLEHRLELVREFQGVRYFDDSFGTTPETAIVAIEAFKEPKIVILGGSDKGASYQELAQKITDSNVKAVVTIGTTGPKIAHELRTLGFSAIHEGGTTMEHIVDACRRLASEGDVVLLSTGSASFGLFNNYKDRGEQFKKSVLSLS